MGYNVYKGNELIAENIDEKEYTVEGLEPDTEYSFSVSEVLGDKESERATVTVKTKPVRVESVNITPKTNNLEVDTTRQLNVAIEPGNATNQSVSYSSDNEGVATVNNDGLVTAISEGTSIITATVDGKSDTATINVTEPEPEPEPEPDPEE